MTTDPSERDMSEARPLGEASGKPQEKPILFSAAMVRAILAGEKTQTRRVVNPQPPSVESVSNHAGTGYHWMNCADQGNPVEWRPVGPVWAVAKEAGDDPKRMRLKCPYGTVGDRLWVRETWRYWEDAEIWDCIQYRADSAVRKPDFQAFPDVAWGHFEQMCDGYEHDHRWKPSIHMPRWASRITLEITGVRVERLQDISEADCIAEGGNGNWCWYHFAQSWESINGKGSWENNPWVWVIEFRRIT